MTLPGDLYVFRAEWPITDDAVTLRELIAKGIEELNAMLTEKRARLLEPPVWTTRVEKGCIPKLIAEAPAEVKAEAPRREPARCGTQSGHKRHRMLGETPCDPCRLAWNAAERARYASRAQEQAAG